MKHNLVSENQNRASVETGVTIVKGTIVKLGLDVHLEFIVADRGPGVPPEERERIFEPFYRPATSPPDTGGSGLGLSIAQRLAAAQGGTVRHEPREGGGSLFILRLPAADLSEVAESSTTRTL